MREKATGYLPTLDGWRSIAILAVILDHTIAYQLGPRYPFLMPLAGVGQNGVSLFFAISGFLICSRLIEEEDLCGRISLRGFYIRRVSRILPPAMFYLAMIGALGIAGVILVSPSDWWASVLFFRNYLPPSAIHRGWGGYTVHYWSLAVEEHFYFLWPMTLVACGYKRAKWAAIGLTGVIAIWRIWDVHSNFVEARLPGLLPGTRTDLRIDGLLMGCLAALILANQNWGTRYRQLLNIRTWTACVAAYGSIQIVQRHHNYTILESILLAFDCVWHRHPPCELGGTFFRTTSNAMDWTLILQLVFMAAALSGASS